MRKLSSLFLFLVTATVWADGPGDFNLGMLGGPSFSNASLTPSSSTATSRTGLAIGADLVTRMAGIFYFRPELLYVQGGYNNTILGISTSVNYDTLQIPLLVQVEGPIADTNLNFFAMFGPDLGIRVSSNFTAVNTSIDLGPYTNSAILALDFGGGMEYFVAPKVGVFAEFRYSLGLLSAANGNTGNSQFAIKSAYNRDIQVLFGFHVGV